MPKPKLTAAEKERRKNQRKAEALNKTAAKSYGPLFAHLAPVHTAESAAWHRRHVRAGMAEHLAQLVGPARHGLVWLSLWSAYRFARAAVGAVAADALWAYGERLHGASVMNRYSLWAAALTRSDRIVLRYESRTDPADPSRRRVVEAEAWPPDGYAPPLTWEQFRVMFPANWDYAEAVEGDDDPHGLFPRVMAAIGGRPC